jgi:parvulin-like peptidyl-prolyl isomerase
MKRKDAFSGGVSQGKWKRRLLSTLAAVAVVGVCILIRSIGSRPTANAQAPTGRADAATARGAPAPMPGNAVPAQSGGATSSQQQTVAVVNNEPIPRQDLAQACLSQYGKEVLEGVMNKYLIKTYCEQKGIKVSNEDVDEEIAKMAKKFSIPVDQWLQMLQQERNIKPEQYRSDVIWPTLALRKLAAARIQPTPQEIDEVFEAQYGAAIRARLIVVNDAATAKEVYAKAKANPDDFPALARRYSKDPTSASVNGLIQPIRRYVGEPKIEEAAFKLKDGEVAPPVEVHGQFAILKCEGLVDPAPIDRKQVQAKLEELVRDKKLRTASAEVFEKLQHDAKVVNVYNNPELRNQMPGVAATINGRSITLRELSDECIVRYGEQVLDQMVNRKLLEQELKKQNIKVTQQDIDAEIARAAQTAGKLTKDGKPDVDAWLQFVEKEQGVSRERYLNDSVWPSTALKLLAMKVLPGEVNVAEQDIQKGFQANFGKRAQVRAIVVDNQRRAQEVWQMAREKPTAEYFGKLAEQYSVEPASRANQGHVPPIQQFGGQPELEKEAFALKAGEISGIIQVTNKYIILFMEGFTQPVKVQLAEVRNDIVEDIHEKKLRMAMAKEFERLTDDARIDNFLAGISHSPARKAAGSLQPGATAPASQASGRGGTPDTATVPASYETTGLLPRSSPPPGGAAAAAQAGGAPPPRSGSVVPPPQ